VRAWHSFRNLKPEFELIAVNTDEPASAKQASSKAQSVQLCKAVHWSTETHAALFDD